MALDLDALSGPHIARAWFAAIDLPSGLRRLHTGVGEVEIGGFTWEGISDPFGGQLVHVSSIEEPDFGQATAIEATIAGTPKSFIKTMWDDRHAVEGAACDMYFAIFDAETGEALSGLEHMFPGKITAPKFAFSGPTIRAIQMTIVSEFEGLNFPSTEFMWSPAGQRARFPGDAGLDYINVPAQEFYRE